MRIHLPSHTKQALGGGWTFRRTFEKYAGAEITTPDLADVILISGATMAESSHIAAWRQQGKKIVLRVDNIPRNSRNRNTGTSRLKAYAQVADLVVFQSEWARRYISPFLGVDGPVILNGADPEIFTPKGPHAPRHTEGVGRQFLYAQYNRDETKQWHQAWYRYIQEHRKDPGNHLRIVGQFSPEQVEYNFDFFCGERFQYVGVVDQPEAMADIYRATDVLLLPYFNDACSNTLVEALLCGVQDIWQNGTGGNEEIMQEATCGTGPGSKLRADVMAQAYIDVIKEIR